jgi:hypothetical protein
VLISTFFLDKSGGGGQNAAGTAALVYMPSSRATAGMRPDPSIYILPKKNPPNTKHQMGQALCSPYQLQRLPTLPAHRYDKTKQAVSPVASD